jgi:hypothetical protein
VARVEKTKAEKARKEGKSSTTIRGPLPSLSLSLPVPFPSRPPRITRRINPDQRSTLNHVLRSVLDVLIGLKMKEKMDQRQEFGMDKTTE